MRRLDILQQVQAEIAEDSRRATLMAMVEGQIAALERLLESNASSVKDAGAWNTTAGFIDQLRFWAPRMFFPSGENADWLAEKIEGAPAHPLFGKD